MAKKEDLRITKTKAALTNAFYAMLEDMSLEEITVNDLCEKAEVRRATFYKHFNDKGDFILYLIKDVREKFETEVWAHESTGYPSREYYKKYVETLMAYLIKRKDAIKNIVLSSARSTLIETFSQQNLKDTKKRLEESQAAGMQLISTPAVVASMLVGGTARAIVDWFEDEQRCPLDVLLKEIGKIIDRVLA
ncbi:MAG: TetR/AcrR family transcriptional regulator [Clostridia bacterium]|nr:TetR/AcrR family transcriptional regulator [Clostridia bacterium]